MHALNFADTLANSAEHPGRHPIIPECAGILTRMPQNASKFEFLCKSFSFRGRLGLFVLCGIRGLGVKEICLILLYDKFKNMTSLFQHCCIMAPSAGRKNPEPNTCTDPRGTTHKSWVPHSWHQLCSPLFSSHPTLHHRSLLQTPS